MVYKYFLHLYLNLGFLVKVLDIVKDQEVHSKLNKTKLILLLIVTFESININILCIQFYIFFYI